MTLITTLIAVIMTATTPMTTSQRGEMLIPNEIKAPNVEVRRTNEKRY